MFNATLQGGAFLDNSPYFIDKTQVSSIYLQYDFGFAFTRKRFGFNYIQKFTSPEFNGGRPHSFGNIVFYIPL